MGGGPNGSSYGSSISLRGQNLLTRLTGGQLKKFYGSGAWKDETIYERASTRADATPDKIAIRDSSAALTYQELLDLAGRIASELHASGLRPGDRVAAWMSSRVELASLLLACSRQGYVLCPSLHRNHTVEEIATLLSRCSARALYVEAGYGADANSKDIINRAAELPHVRNICSLDASRQRAVIEIAAALCPTAGKVPRPEDRPDDIVYLAFTSGTTANRKG